jgi:hypothetical protein
LESGASLTIKFLNGKKMAKAWGQAEPPELRKILEYLCDEDGFLPPKNWSHAYTLDLYRELTNDLVANVGFSTAGEFPVGVIYFDTTIALRSKFCRKIEDQIQIWPNQTPSTEGLDASAQIFCITLSHLKWNDTPGDRNPGYQISTAPEYKNSSVKWIADWKQYAAPIIAGTSTLKEAIQFCEKIKTYKKQPWVKSDGYRAQSVDIYLAFLLVQDGQLEKARGILQVGLKLQTHLPSIERHQKALVWVMDQIAAME